MMKIELYCHSNHIISEIILVSSIALATALNELDNNIEVETHFHCPSRRVAIEGGQYK